MAGRPTRPVRFHEQLLESFTPGTIATAVISLRVSKGTYIRSIARDLGRITLERVL